MADVMVPRRSHEIMEGLTAEDFETASIRSAAPSYSSEAPTLHYTVPNSGYSSLLPPYTAPPVGSAERVAAPPRHHSVPALQPHSANAVAARRGGSASAASANGAGTVFALPARMDNVRRDDIPDLSRFRVPSWSTISTSPNARLYHSVALRRVAAAEHASAAAEIGGLMRRLAVLERMEQEEAAASRRMAAAAAHRNASAGNGNASGSASNNRSGNGGGNNAIGRLSTSNGSFRPLEDPYLVGETAARRARAERMARENNTHGEEALHREDRRWDWFLGSFARPSTVSSPHRSVPSPSATAGERPSPPPPRSHRHSRLHHPFLGH
ncbi:hypothetical protein HMPREF1624_05262 [Sporothrix schenckii ATCC 58251]|uniref:Uncharacterized protein n=1 Tax=Sporothrix schenckii (strain ATCC 58251 / de Perez 2211183) TaxID=1391915 RepID=U7PS72_SPOS1|nr:hypothetical protein HMPREF1624_05262 [Sporothrix schenckii ATCC 58251]